MRNQVIFLLILQVYTIYAGDVGFMAINGKRVNMKNINGSHTSGEYDFIDGELANITCQKTYKDAVIMTMGYDTNATQIWTEATTRATSDPMSVMYIKLTADNNRAHIDCLLKNFNVKLLKHFQIFLKQKYSKPDIAFVVNGLLLTPAPDQDIHNFLYKYKYYDDEKLTIQSFIKGGIIANNCSVKPQPHSNGIVVGSDVVSTPKKLELLNADFWSSQKKEISINLKNDDFMIIKCLVNTNKFGVNEISLSLEPNLFDYYPYIQGLSMSKVLVKIPNTIHYQYESKIHMRCYSKTPEPEWNYSNTSVSFINTTTQENYLDNIVSGEFELLDNITSAVICCLAPASGKNKTQKSCVTLIKKIYYTMRNNISDGTEIYPENSPIGSTELPNTESKIKDSNRSEPETLNIYMLIGVSVATIILVVIVAYFVVRIVRGKRKLRNANPSDINYVNLPHHNEGQMPMPSQWSDTALYSAPVDCAGENVYAKPYIPETVEELYTKPTPRAERSGPSQPKYEDAAYATIGNVEPTYTQAMPSNLRKVKAPKGNEILYSKVLLKTNRSPQTGTQPKPLKSPLPEKPKVAPRMPVNCESPYAEVNHENPYAEVIRESPYAEVNNASSYQNVFDSNKYVNANSKVDYVEPAYCEINVKK